MRNPIPWGAAGLLMLAVVVAGCRDGVGRPQDPAPQDPPSSKVKPTPALVGTWNWLVTSGGIAGGPITPGTCRCSQKLFFRVDSTYQFFKWDSTLEEGRYSVFRRAFPRGDTSWVVQLHPPDRTHWPPYYFVDTTAHDTLRISDGAADGYSHVFFRIR